MSQKEFTSETRKNLIEKRERALFSKLGLIDSSAQEIAMAFLNYGENSYSVQSDFIRRFKNGETPIDFINRTELKHVIKECIPDKTDRQKYELIIQKSNQFQYSTGYYRRSIRSVNYAFGIEQNVNLLFSYFTFGIFKCTLSQFLRNDLTGELLDLKNHTNSYEYNGHDDCSRA